MNQGKRCKSSTRHSKSPSARVLDGAYQNGFASRGKSLALRLRSLLGNMRKNFSFARSNLLVGKALCPGNCERQQVWRGSGAAKGYRLKRSTSYRLSMIGSPKVSRHAIWLMRSSSFPHYG